jgi:hypothetical protein
VKNLITTQPRRGRGEKDKRKKINITPHPTLSRKWRGELGVEKFFRYLLHIDGGG